MSGHTTPHAGLVFGRLRVDRVWVCGVCVCVQRVHVLARCLRYVGGC